MMAGGGIGTVIVLLAVMFLGGDPGVVLQQMNQANVGNGGQAIDVNTPEAQRAKEFVSVVLADTEDVWNDLFAKAGREYREPTLVLFSGGVESACGYAGTSVGPFYCPADEKVYIDLAFFDELERRFNAEGDFAQAYVIAHEIGHHVQKVLGIEERTRAARSRMSERQANEMSVRQELQGDYFAGVWAHHAQRTKQILEAGDVEEALNAASAVGDDNIQKQTQGRITPDSFTHGTSAQRASWFRKGLESGDMNGGDTFAAGAL
jgi:hypothetical protein